jgi:GT2 family glycosyltransferase
MIALICKKIILIKSLMKSLSVIILTYNSEKDIYDCLKSIYQFNDIGDALEIIVVDNHSTHFATMQNSISNTYPNVIITQNTQNGGYGQGNNVGIRMASAPSIAIMNPDIRLNKPIFASMLECLKQKDVAMCAGKQYGGNGVPFASFMSIFTVPWWIGRPLEFICRRILDIYIYKMQFLSGAFFAIKKDIMHNIGLFDEEIFMYAEENDIHYRIRKQYPNMKMIYKKELSYIHLAENRSFSKEQAKRVYESIGYFFKKNNFSPVKYWKGQIRLNKLLELVYSALNFLHIGNPTRRINMNLEERNQILKELILREE